jgi:hypothetical protein
MRTDAHHLDPKLTGEIVRAYSEMLEEREGQGWELFLITLMFNQLKGKRESVIAQMNQGAERAYGTLLNQMYRHPRDNPTAELPLWILVPDLPVPKHSKQPLRDLQVNGGMHLHGMAAIPPNTRLNARLDQHFEIDENRYIKPGFPLRRIHAKHVTETLEYTTSYAFKNLSRGNFDFDQVLILPHAGSEMSVGHRPSSHKQPSGGLGEFSKGL